MTHEHDPAEVERVARGLTNGERKIVVGASIKPTHYSLVSGSPRVRLFRKGVLEWHHDGTSTSFVFTSLGLLVRAHLLREQQEGQG